MWMMCGADNYVFLFVGIGAIMHVVLHRVDKDGISSVRMRANSFTAHTAA
jgi:hypothetical protein